MRREETTGASAASVAVTRPLAPGRGAASTRGDSRARGALSRRRGGDARVGVRVERGDVPKPFSERFFSRGELNGNS